jgi:hypothetical protein
VSVAGRKRRGQCASLVFACGFAFAAVGGTLVHTSHALAASSSTDPASDAVGVVRRYVTALQRDDLATAFSLRCAEVTIAPADQHLFKTS